MKSIDQSIPQVNNIQIPYIERVEQIGKILIDWFHLIGLFILFSAVVYMAGENFIHMLRDKVTLKDILLLFIYLEIGAMIGIYFKTHKLPVHFLLYVAITALARVLTIDIKTMDNYTILTISTSILIIVLSIYLLNIHNKEARSNSTNN
jgi:phosphate starvation-inducible membrane PsiE